MTGENTVPRRALLAVFGTAAASTAGVQADDSDLSEPPYTREYNDVTCTYHDCAHVTVDTDRIGDLTLEIEVQYNSDRGHTSTEIFEIADPEFPYEFVANCHVDRVDDLAYGSATVRAVTVYDNDDHVQRFTSTSLRWDCDDVREREVDPRVLDEYCEEGEMAELSGTDDHDDDPHRRPAMYTERGVEVTAHDCARVTVEANEVPQRIGVRVIYHDEDAIGPAAEEEIAFEPDGHETEFVSNCHLDYFEPDFGSSYISYVAVRTASGEILEWELPVGSSQGADCLDVARSEVDQDVLAEHCE